MTDSNKFKWSCGGRHGFVWAETIDEAMLLVQRSHSDLDQPIYLVPYIESPVLLISDGIDKARQIHPFYSATIEERIKMIDQFFLSTKEFDLTEQDLELFIRERH